MLTFKNLEKIDKNTVDLVLSQEAKSFLEEILIKFEPKRKSLLKRRKEEKPVLNFLPETESIRSLDWKVINLDPRLEKRIVEITGPANGKTFINALNSRADVFMADFEDSLTFSWQNILEGQRSLYRAVRKDLAFQENGKDYKLEKNHTAKLAIRVRGLHLDERNLLLDGESVGGGIVDYVLSIFHNGKEKEQQNEGFPIYIPKLEHYLEARFWKELIDFVEERLNLQGSTKATLLVETLPACFQMNEFIWELNGSIAGLNAGRWDYLFSVMKCFPSHSFPDRKKLTMKESFMTSYVQLLVETCHKRGVHAIGGMSAFIPNKQDEEATKKALEQVKEDKFREVRWGFDGTWVAHPDLIQVARKEFQDFIGDEKNQKHYLPNYEVSRKDLLNFPKGQQTKEEKIENIKVSLIYITSWLKGQAAVNIYNLMEDVATAEIARIQLKKEDSELIKEATEELLSDPKYESLSFARSEIVLRESLETRPKFLTEIMINFLED